MNADFQRLKGFFLTLAEGGVRYHTTPDTEITEEEKKDKCSRLGLTHCTN